MDHKGQEEIALHRWAVIAEAAGDRLTPGERGALVRQIAARAHTHPDGSARRYSRGTIDRWLRAWRGAGWRRSGPRPGGHRRGARPPGAVRRGRRAAAGAARPVGRADRLDLVPPARDDGLGADGPRPAAPAGLHREALAAEPKAYGRYEAARPNERWITDVLVGPWVPYPSGRARCGPGCS